MSFYSNIEYFLNIQSSFLDVLDIHLDIHSISEYSKRIFIINFWNIHLNCSSTFPFRDTLKDIHQINSGYPGYSHEYSFFILNISLVILVIRMDIHFWFWISLLEKEYSSLFWIFRTPLTRRCRVRGVSRHLCQK